MRQFCFSILLMTFFTMFAHAGDGPNHFEEPGMVPGREYINQHFAENIDPLSGSLQLQYVDVFIPGNGGFDLKVQRSYNVRKINEFYSPFGRGWDIHFGRIKNRVGQTVCSATSAQSMMLELPDGSLQTLYAAKAGAFSGTVAAGSFVTTQLWKAQCDPVGGGVVVFGPDGTRYDITISVTRTLPNDHFWLVSKITDRNGNYADFTYENQVKSGRSEIKTINTSDSRLITFNYTDSRLTSIVAGGRTWGYNVTIGHDSVPIASDSNHYLKSVTPPAGANWAYEYHADLGLSAGSFLLKKLTNPQGGTITYAYNYVNFLVGVVNPTQSTVVSSKITTDGTWTFNYLPSSGSQYDVTTVTQPGGLGTITYKHYGYRSTNSVWKIGLLQEKSIGTDQVETFNWNDFLVISDEDITRPGYQNIDLDVKKPLLSSRVIQRGTQSYTTAYSAFDAWGNPAQIVETGNNGSRTRSPISYFQPTSKWIMGLVQNETMVGAGPITREYDANNGNLTSERRYGVTTSYTYFLFPSLLAGSVNVKTNPRLMTTTYTNYERGVAKTETRQEGVIISRAVDYFGNVTSESDGIGTWGYGYDGLNRITSITTPRTDDSNVGIVWANNNTRTLTRGTLVETKTFDGYGRLSNVVRAGITTSFEYDALGRKTFESFPGGGTAGVTLILDLLGRVKQTLTTGAGTKFFTYTGANVSVQNERNLSTTYSYDRYGNPDEGFLVGISTPVAASNITMNKDVIGLLNSVTQNGVTRSYTYYQNLNKYLWTITEPETGTTTFGRDNNGNMTSKVVGGTTVNYTYDGLDRLWTDSSTSTTYDYNNRGQVTKITKAAIPTSVRDYDYDANGNMKLDKLTVDGNIFQTNYTHTALDGLDTITYPLNNRIVTFASDVRGLPTKVLPYAVSAAHHPSGNLSALTYGNGISTTFGENSWQLPDEIGPTSSATLRMKYVYDGVGNVNSILSTLNTDPLTFCYDGVDRLTNTSSSSYCSGTPEFAYDGGGNLTKNGATNYDIYTANRLIRTTGGTNRTLDYDLRGNIVGYGSNTFDFDSASNLTCINCLVTARKIEYAYDGKGQRIWQQKGGKKTYFFHAANGDLLLEYTPYGKVYKEHAYLHGKRIATREGSNATVLTLGLSASPASPSYDAQVTLTATGLSGATGSVEFFDGTTSLGTANIAGGQASKILTGLSVGIHNLSANYDGDANYLAASKTLSLVVSKASQTISFSALTGRVPGEPSFTITATASSGLSVLFTSATPTICTTGGSNGSTVTLTGVTASCTIVASQPGDTNYNAAFSVSQSFTVARANTTISLTSSNYYTLIGQGVTFTATLAGAYLPTGTVTFTDGGTVINTATVQSATSSYSTNLLSVGTHSLQATYSGDSNNGQSASNIATQTVSKYTSSATCSVSASTIVNTANLTLTVNVTGGTPSGTITVTDNGATIATGGVSNGSASIVFRLPTLGAHSIVAAYEGDGANLPSSCAAISVTVNFDPALLLILFDDD